MSRSFSGLKAKRTTGSQLCSLRCSRVHFFLSFFTVITMTTSYFRIKFTTRWYTNDLLKQRHNGSSWLRDQFREYSGDSYDSLSLFLSFSIASRFQRVARFLLVFFFAVLQLLSRSLEASIALQSKLVSRLLFNYVGGRSLRRDYGHRLGKKRKFKSFSRL